MVGMGGIWDETMSLIGRRSGPIVLIAVLVIALPTALSGVLNLYAPIVEPATASLIGLAGIVATVLTLLAQLALTALALADDGDPAPTAGQALRIGLARLPRALLLVLALMLGMIVLMVPVLVILIAGGVDPMLVYAGTQPRIGTGAGLALFAYLLVLAPVLLFVVARLALVSPVVVAERRHVGAIGRSWSLTRGLTFKLVALLILYAILALIVLGATRVAVGALLLVAFGNGEAVNAATVTVAVLSALLSAALSTVSTLFVARLYHAIVAADGHRVPGTDRGAAGIATDPLPTR